MTSLRATLAGPYRWLRDQTTRSRQIIPMAPRMLRGVVNALLVRSDNERWGNEANLEQWWETRTIKLAAFVPKGARVIEFGAGRCRLPLHLDPSCVYFASDLVPRIPGTIVCDLNKRPLPDLAHLQLDATFFAGVMEYIADLPALATWLGTQARLCVVSYDAVKAGRWTPARVAELSRRKYFGYMSDYEAPEFVQIFEAAGFRLVRSDRWETQTLYAFERVDAA